MSLDTSSGADDSLVDVEAHIREMESYLHSAAATAAGAAPLLALANSRGRNNNNAAATADNSSAALTPAPYSTSAPVEQPPTSTPRVTIDLSSHASASRFSTPSTISTLRDESNAYEYDAARHSLAASTPQSLSSSRSQSTISSSQSRATDPEKDRLVQQLLRQHRQAQSTAAAHSKSATQAVVAPPPVAAPRPPPQPSASSAPMDRSQRDALVERLLQERRQQRNATETNNTSPRSVQSRPPSRPVPDAHTRPFEPRPLQPPVAIPPLPLPQSMDASLDEDADHDSSIASHHSSAFSPTHSHTHTSRSRSSASSPMDPRFGGAAQTIFDASEWLNEDGTSIIHDSNPPTHRSQQSDAREEEESLSHSRESFDDASRPSGRHSRDASTASTASSPSSVTSPTEFAPARAQRFSTAATGARSSRAATSATTAARRTIAGGRSPPSATARGRIASRGRPQERSMSQSQRAPSATRRRPATAGSSSVRAPSLSNSRYSKAAIIAEIERERAEACTFAPRLIAKPLLATDASLEERLEVWSTRAAANHARQLEARKEYEEEKLAECTFAPRINASSSRGRARDVDPVAAAERLHHEADHRTHLREKARRLNEAEQLASMPFAPALSVASRRTIEKKGASAAKPIYQRVADLQRAKNEKLHALLLDQRSSGGKELTFAPRINPLSERMAREKEKKEAEARAAEESEEPTSADRLSQSASTRLLSKKLQAAHALESELAKTYTFKPAVNPVSEKLLQTSRVFQGPNADFLTRQERLSEAARAEQRERERAAEQDVELTFKPNIGNASAVLAAAKKRTAQTQGDDADTTTETSEQQADRLSSREAKSLTLLKAKLKVMHESQQGCTFRPAIGAVSRALAEQRSATLAQLGSDENAARAVAADLLSQRLSAEFASTHTFKPTINAASQEMVASGLVESHYDHRDMNRLTSQIAEDQHAKQQRLDSLAKRAQVAELAGCTFAPTVNPSVPKPAANAKPVLIKGMNRFLQLKALKARQDADQLARERKVFMIDAAEAPPSLRPYTVAQPFTLSHEQRASQREAARERAERDAEAARMRECSFAPITKQAQNRQMIQHILQEPDCELEDV